MTISLTVLNDFLSICPRAGVDCLHDFAAFRTNRKCGKGKCRICAEAITFRRNRNLQVVSLGQRKRNLS